MMSENYKKFQSKAIGTGTKQVYYLCMEFLMGRSLDVYKRQLGHFVEVLAIPAALQEVQSVVGNIVAHDERVGVVADPLQVVDLGGDVYKRQIVSYSGKLNKFMHSCG